MRFDILTIFPEMFRSPLEQSILKRAIERGLVEVHLHDIRDSASDRHKSVDDTPYGGGAGMVMRPDVVVKAIEAVERRPSSARILLTPHGERLDQKLVRELAGFEQLILICGRYEGIDYRVNEIAIDREISIGDYILSGGEMAALVVVDALIRLLPGVLGNDDSAGKESFEDGLLEHPHYTKPRVFRGMEVPEVLLSGDHSRIEKWRAEKAVEITKLRRADLYNVDKTMKTK